MGRSPSYVVGALGIAAATTLFLLGGRPLGSAAPSPELTQVASDLDARLREMAAGLRSRAQTLADLPRLAAAVATDAATVQDLTQDELAFRLKDGETIEIGQITKAGKAVSLLRIPSSAPQLAKLDTPGGAVEPTKGGFILSEVVSIKPTVTTEIERGAVAVSWKVDAAPFVAKLGALGAARIELAGQVVGATEAAIPEGAGTVRVPLPGIAARGGAVVAAAPPPPSGPSPLRLAALGIAAVTLLLAGFLYRRGSASPSLPPVVIDSPQGAARVMSSTPAVSGSMFGRYTLLRKLGSGGMAEVYLARSSGEAGFERDVALKIMHKDLAQVPDIVDHFLDEARLASRLSHPNIVQIYDLGKSGSDYFIAMEHIDGFDLDYLLHAMAGRGEKPPARVALAIVRKVCDGLHAAHTATASDGTALDLVHRDVKAENVLISRKGEVKIADFGIAKAKQRSRTTQIGMVKGTAAYMAPEHRLGKPVDRRADVYGVGAILYELLTATEINLDLEQLAHLGRDGWPHLRPPSEINTTLPREIDALVFKALSYEANDRYESCAAMEDALEAFAIAHGMQGSDKTLVQWVERELAILEGRPARPALTS